MTRQKLLTGLFLILSSTIGAQEFVSRLSSTGLTLNTQTISDEYIIRASEDESGFVRVVAEKNSEEMAGFLIRPFSLELFRAKLKNNLFGNLSAGGILSSNLDESAENESRIVKLYSDISSYFNTVNEKPEVALVKLKNDIRVYAEFNKRKSKSIKSGSNKKSKNDKDLGKKKYRIEVGFLTKPSIQISFYAGFIEKIEVSGEIGGNQVRFANKYSIGVSSLKNIKNFKRTRLFSLRAYDLEIEDLKPNYTGNHRKPINGNSSIVQEEKSESNYLEFQGKEYSLTIKPNSKENVVPDEIILDSTNDRSLIVYLEDLIDYQRIIDVNANDISPDVQKINIDQQQLSAKLYREESTKIIEAVVYTDLLGTLNEENPNGIIQTEINKKFNISTARSNFFQTGGYGLFEYLDAQILISKIEEDNKFLLPSGDNFELLEMFRFRNFSVGGLLNIGAVEFQNFKMNLFYDSGFKFSRSGYRFDEDDSGLNVNTIEWVHQFKVHIFPERRYGIIFRDKLFYYEVLESNTDFISMLDKKKDWINTIELSAYLDIATSAKLFVRYGFVHELNDFSKNFSRFQLGTVFYILQKNRKDK